MIKSQRKGTGMVSKALLKEAVILLPRIPVTDNFREVKQFVQNNLRYNSVTTRKRYESYITTYLFPNGFVDKEILIFARVADDASIKNVCLYRFCRKYPLMYDLFDDLFIPYINKGYLYKKQIDLYLADRFSNNNPGRFGGRGFIEALSGADVVKYEKSILKYHYRKIDLPSFAFILHSEFSEPGMYNLSKVRDSRVYRSQLWRKGDLIDALYSLRNLDLISKISDIDMMKQFTTKYSLMEIVERLR